MEEEKISESVEKHPASVQNLLLEPSLDSAKYNMSPEESKMI